MDLTSTAASKSQGGRKILACEEADAITVQNQTDSPLLRLPGEIRNSIYAYAVGGHCIYAPDDESDGVINIKDPNGHHCPKEHFLALSRVCRQTRSESARMIFSHNDFGCAVNFDQDLEDLGYRFTNNQRNAIQAVRLEGCHLMCFEDNPRPFDAFPAIQRVTLVGGLNSEVELDQSVLEGRVRRAVGIKVEVRFEVTED